MANKHLPIQFFEKRKDFDDRTTEGGGASTIPNWVLTGDQLIAKSDVLSNSVNELTDVFHMRKQQEKRLPMVVCTTLNEKAIAKSHRGEITSLYTDSRGSNVVGFAGDRCLLTMISDEEVLQRIGGTVSDIETHAKLISAITDIEPFYPAIDLYDENTKYYKVRLINYNNYDLNCATKIIFEQQCAEAGISITQKTKFTQDITIYRVCIDSAEKLSLLEECEGIYTVEKMLPISVTLDALSTTKILSPKSPVVGESYPVVGVLDTGIEDNAYLQNWKTHSSFTSYPNQYRDPSHGSFVSGIIEYGDELNDFSYTMLPGVQLFDATVYPDESKEAIYVDDLIEHIREAVQRNNHIKVWNLSLGTNNEASLDDFSDFGMALDNIQDENQVLIIKSAGNCKNFLRQLPKSRIAQSADSVRSIVVGSLAHAKNSNDYAEIDAPSPFTRVGPGPGSIVKPDLVFYGGNAGVSNGSLSRTGLKSFAPNGDIVSNVGTSFSTPWVTRMAAELIHLVNGEFDPLLIRALLIHNAKYPANCEMSMTDKVTQMGFGMPSCVQEMLYNSEDEITLILRDTLDKGSFIEMFDFPFPESLIDENGNFVGQIIATLVTKSLLDDKQSGEYCQSNIDILFGTYETETDRDTTKPTIKNPKGLGEPQNVLLDSLYSSRVKNAHPMTGFERECTLVKYGKKFHPVKKYAVDLADMTPSNKQRYLAGNRKWYLKIEGLYRDFIEQDAAAHSYQLSQEYCLLLTIKDPNGNAPVYDQVVQQLENRNFVHHDIHLRNVISIDGVANE
ncbi:MAG: S8 family peptidase [Clostridia bacterium]|nr:S8 family peptidase [Clostridia bacterium]